MRFPRSIIVFMIALFGVASFSGSAQAAPCTFVALDGAGNVVESATGHGPRGCKRAKRRCQRRAGRACVPNPEVNTRHCSPAAQSALNDAIGYIRSHRRELMEDFEVGSRRATRRRIKRRFDRKINKLRISCAERVLCREKAPRIALHAFGIAGNKLRICYDKMVRRNYQFCNLVEITAHEIGHTIGIKKDRAGGHHRNQNDRVYQFGWHARNICLSDRTGAANYSLRP